MIVRDLCMMFIYTDPKATVIIDDSSKQIYKGRVEFLVNCDNPIEELTVVGLGVGTIDEDTEKYVGECLFIEVKEALI